ncbi:MAG: hypothetical protein JSU59_05365, partial [Nitrospirota bacterium]
MPPPQQTSRFDDVNLSPQGKAGFIPTRVVSRKIRAFIDSLAAGVVWVGGIATIVSILGIFVYLLIEVVPLFTAPTEISQARFPLSSGTSEQQQLWDVGLDEYQEVAYVVERGQVNFFSLPGGTPIPVQGTTVSTREQVTSVARSKGRGHDFALGSEDGRAIPIEIEFTPSFENGQRTIIPSLQIGD